VLYILHTDTHTHIQGYKLLHVTGQITTNTSSTARTEKVNGQQNNDVQPAYSTARNQTTTTINIVFLFNQPIFP